MICASHGTKMSGVATHRNAARTHQLVIRPLESGAQDVNLHTACRIAFRKRIIFGSSRPSPYLNNKERFTSRKNVTTGNAIPDLIRPHDEHKNQSRHNITDTVVAKAKLTAVSFQHSTESFHRTYFQWRKMQTRVLYPMVRRPGRLERCTPKGRL